LEQFPEVRSLARAELGDVIRAWQGLGYNRRAVNLHRAAQVIVRDHGGRVPGDVQTLRTLPGLGDYTASAVACVAFDAQVPVVDVNVHRVVARAVHGKQPRDVLPSLVRETAVDLLPRGEAYRWSQALMDLGATLCTSGAPHCDGCPLAATCAYSTEDHPRARPASSMRATQPFEGSSRQHRGRVIQLLRGAPNGLTLGVLAQRSALPSAADTPALSAILEGLERDGLVVLTRAARAGSNRGIVRLPR
ncbi:MAG TPA: A/G-specific adenine glycosylase, partial [Actinomycetota bacterium]|nr:A/G-specific adenine glycosylase [Actinomycetota bacterium]